MTYSNSALKEMVELVRQVTRGARAEMMLAAAASSPHRVEAAEYSSYWAITVFPRLWEELYQTAMPKEELRAVLQAPEPIETVLAFKKLALVSTSEQIEAALLDLLGHLKSRIEELRGLRQLTLFEAEASPRMKQMNFLGGYQVASLEELLWRGLKFPTIYADPPWAYKNEASRAAAVNHYPTLSLEEICAEPVRELAADNAHLHLWTTNGFLREAFQVIEAWGFTFKSCLVWIKEDLGMGNYWRVSHEFLLLGVRGRLKFRSHKFPSWIKARRTIHSRKPAMVRSLIEKVSPGPYLELYGREAFPHSDWTVYGNQIERRLF